jgi:hypothetical protein
MSIKDRMDAYFNSNKKEKSTNSHFDPVLNMRYQHTESEAEDEEETNNLDLSNEEGDYVSSTSDKEEQMITEDKEEITA